MPNLIKNYTVIKWILDEKREIWLTQIPRERIHRVWREQAISVGNFFGITENCPKAQNIQGLWSAENSSVENSLYVFYHLIYRNFQGFLCFNLLRLVPVIF